MSSAPSLAQSSAHEPLAALPETAAAQRLYERHANRVFRYLQRLLRSHEEAEDALQTTFLHALKGLRRGVVPEAEVAWLLKIAHTVCLTRWETARRSALEVARDPHVLEDMLVATSIERDELIWLREALERLTDHQRRAILLREWQGLSYREIAEELELTQAAVETLIFRARGALAMALSGEPKARPRRFASVLDVASVLAAVRTLFGGSGTVKVASAIAVAGATLGTGGAREIGHPDPPLHIPPVPAQVDQFVPRDRSTDGVAPATAVAPNQVRPVARVRTSGSRAPASPRRVATPASAPAVDLGSPAAEPALDPNPLPLPEPEPLPKHEPAAGAIPEMGSSESAAQPATDPRPAVPGGSAGSPSEGGKGGETGKPGEGAVGGQPSTRPPIMIQEDSVATPPEVNAPGEGPVEHEGEVVETAVPSPPSSPPSSAGGRSAEPARSR